MGIVKREVIGDCELWNGDAREVIPSLSAFDTIVTDLPYGINLVPPRRKTKAIANDGQDEAKKLWAEILELSAPRLPDNSSHMFWTGWSEVWTKSELERFFKVKSCVVWGKNNFGIGFYTRPQHEFAWYCHKGEPPKLDAPVSDLWLEPKIQAPIHSCEKPHKLLQRCLKLVTGGVVLDPCMGSGSTLVACAKLGRKGIGIEVDEEYFNIAVERVRKAYEQPDLFVPAPKKILHQEDMFDE